MKLSFPFKAFLTYVACTVADFISSMGHFPEGFHETNAYARHLDGSFWPQHALANCALETLYVIVSAAGLYYIIGFLNKKAALFLSALPLFYFAYMHFDAAISNLQTKWLFVPYADPNKLLDLLGKLTGNL